MSSYRTRRAQSWTSFGMQFYAWTTEITECRPRLTQGSETRLTSPGAGIRTYGYVTLGYDH